MTTNVKKMIGKLGISYKAEICVHGKRYCKTYKTKEHAMQWVRQTLVERDAKGLISDTKAAAKTTLGALLTRYATEVSGVARKSKSACSSEKLRVLKMAKHSIANKVLSRLTGSDFEAYKSDRLADCMAVATIDREIGLFIQIIEHARTCWGIFLPENPAKIKRDELNNERSRILTSEELQRLLDGAKPTKPGMNSDVLPIILLASETALRRGELLALEWNDISLERKVALIEKTINVGETENSDGTKNGSKRTIPLSPKALEAFGKIPRVEKDERVFCSGATAIKEAIERCIERVKIDDFHFHDLRHMATSKLAKKLPNVIELAAVTGHKDLKMLQRYYHTTPEELAEKLSKED